MQLFPNIKRVGLVVELADPSGLIEQQETRSECARIGLKYSDVVASDLKKLVEETNKMADNVDIIIISNTRLAMEFTVSLLPMANTKKIPVFSYSCEPVKEGVVAGMGVDEAKLGRMLAESVVEVIVNRKPISRVPVKIDPDPAVCVNQGMMKSLGLKFPDAVRKKQYFTDCTVLRLVRAVVPPVSRLNHAFFIYRKLSQCQVDSRPIGLLAFTFASFIRKVDQLWPT